MPCSWKRDIRRAPWLVGVLTATCTVGGCTTSLEPGAERLADLVPVVEQGVSTDIILPPQGASLTLLGDGWEERTIAQATAEGLWVLGRVGRFRFHVATADPVTLEAEATALTTPDAPQRMEVLVNGHSVHRGAMTRQWSRYEFPLPATDVQIGWNEVELRFDQALRPRDVSPESQDPRRLAARFRRLRVRSGTGRPFWPDRPSTVDVLPVDPDDTPTIAMPTDSTLTFHLLPDADAVLTGEVDVRLASPTSAGEVFASAEVIDALGQTHTLFEYQHATTRRAESFEMALQAWVGQAVRLRLRSWGADNGVIHWNDLTLSTRADASVASVTHPTNLVTPSVSGRWGRSDVILILLDAARADAFNDDEVATPAVDSLARDGTRFLSAVAQAPWTGQSVPSMLTGRYPGAIGAEVWRSPIPVDVPTVAERLRGVGYHTVVWSQHNIYSNNETFRRGFEAFIEVRGTVLDRALLPSADDLFLADQPTFALIHLLPPHGPYRPPEPFDGSLSRWYTGDFPQSAASLGRAARPGERKPTDEDVRYIRSRYNENVRFADHLVGRLVQMFRDAGRYDDALVILTSDHGEGFFEHGRFLHTQLLYDEFLRVPLVIKWPRGETGFATDVDPAVGLVDIAPTLVDGLALPTDQAGFQGRTLLPLVFDGAVPDRNLLVQTRGAERLDATPQPVLALLSDGYKVILDEAAGTLETYDLESDPGEHDDLTDVEPIRARALLQRLLLQRYRNALTLSGHDQGPTEPLDEEAIRRLRALGYLR